MTNAHVVEDADGICAIVAGRPAECHVVFSDSRNDLALLRTERALPSATRFRPDVGLHLGEDVVALGFPLQGLLGTGPQASAGNVSALCGLRNDSSIFQFTAPIASGNSGGPVLDMTGCIIGIVTSSLNLEAVRQSGANAENVNFGIKGAIVRSFLDAYGLQPALGEGAVLVGRAEVVRGSRESVLRINCSC